MSPVVPRLIGALALLVSVSVSAQDVTAQKWEMRATDHIEIFYQSPQRDHLDAVAREAERAYARLSFTLRYDLPAKVPLILVREDRDIPQNRADAAVLVRASGAPLRDHLVMSVESFEKRPAMALVHEMTHQFVFELLPEADRDAPWVAEALPDHCSGIWQPSALATIRDALAHGRVPAVENLTASDRDWGHAVFDFVAEEYGAQGIRQYLPALHTGQPRGDAIRAAFNIAPADFNAAFQKYVRTYFADR